MAKVYLNDIGTAFKVTVGTDLTNATLTELRVLKPGDTMTTTWTATIDDALNGILEYIISTGDLNTAGIYRLQAYVELSTGEKLLGETVGFTVHSTFA